MGLLDALRQVDIFDGLSNTQLELVASVSEQSVVNAGTPIFEQNTPGDSLYVILRGDVAIEVSTGAPAPDHTHILAVLRQGQAFGEIALVDEGLRTARAVARTDDTRLASMPREKLLRLCDAYPQLGYRLMRNLAMDMALKIRSTDLHVREVLTWARRAV